MRNKESKVSPGVRKYFREVVDAAGLGDWYLKGAPSVGMTGISRHLGNGEYGDVVEFKAGTYSDEVNFMGIFDPDTVRSLLDTLDKQDIELTEARDELDRLRSA
jgi:hypothetical protein